MSYKRMGTGRRRALVRGAAPSPGYMAARRPPGPFPGVLGGIAMPTFRPQVRRARSQPVGQLPEGFPGFPGFMPGPLPGPGSPGIPPGATPPTTPYGMFPTNVSWGDVVQISGNFAGMHMGQARVKFAGAPYMALNISGPFGGTVVVPDGARTGACMIEVNGRQVFGTNCVVTPRTGSYGQRAQAEHPEAASWKNFGPSTQLLGDDMSYSADGTEYTRGVGAVAALDRGGASPAGASGAVRQIGARPPATRVSFSSAKPTKPLIMGKTAPIPKTVMTNVRRGGVVQYGVRRTLRTGRKAPPARRADVGARRHQQRPAPSPPPEPVTEPRGTAVTYGTGAPTRAAGGAGATLRRTAPPPAAAPPELPVSPDMVMPVPAPAPRAALPGWVLPVGVGVGVLVLAKVLK